MYRFAACGPCRGHAGSRRGVRISCFCCTVCVRRVSVVAYVLDGNTHVRACLLGCIGLSRYVGAYIQGHTWVRS